MNPMKNRPHGFVRTCLVAALLTATASAQTLVGLWRFETTGSSQSDSTSNNNTATASGNAAWTNDTSNVASSPFDGSNGVFAFDGTDDFLTVAHSASIALAGDLTLAAWIKGGSSTGDGHNILTKVSPSGTPASFIWTFKHTGLVPELTRGNGSTSATLSDDTALSTGTWQHWAVTMSGTNVTFFLNGSSVGSGTLSTTLGDTGRDLHIGMRTGFGNEFNGSLDDVAIFNGALGQSAIATIMTGDFSAYGVAVPEPGTNALIAGFAAAAFGIVVRRRQRLHAA